MRVLLGSMSRRRLRYERLIGLRIPVEIIIAQELARVVAGYTPEVAARAGLRRINVDVLMVAHRGECPPAQNELQLEQGIPFPSEVPEDGCGYP